MDHELTRPVRATELASALGLQLMGPDQSVTKISSLADASAGSLCFLTSAARKLAPGSCTIASEPEQLGGETLLLSKQPRLDFARALLWLKGQGMLVSPSAPPSVHESVAIGSGSTIGNGSIVGAGTVIGSNVTIGENVLIGRNCVVKSNAVIGEDGFGFERDLDGTPVRLIHLGGVRIGDCVEIGSLTTVCRGTLLDTVIEDHVKVDDHVHIAHNVYVAEGAFVVACAELSGGVKVGPRAWIGPNASVIQKVSVGADALVGIAANVLKDVPPGAVVVGNPAKKLDR